MIYRPAFIIAALVFVLYFVPAMVLGTSAAVLFMSGGVVIALLFWVAATTALDVQPRLPYLEALTRSSKKIPVWPVLALYAALLSLYLGAVPFTCTAGYAILVDHSLAPTVREMTGKLLAARWAPHVLNVLSGAVCPILAYALLVRRRWWLLLLPVVILTPLLSGAKGEMIPMVVTLAVTGWISAPDLVARVDRMLAVALISMALMGAMEAYKESYLPGKYDFAGCAASLGVTENMQQDLIPQGTPPHTSFSLGLLERVFTVPYDVATKYYQYVTDFGSPGWHALPVYKVSPRLYGPYADVASDICRVYYHDQGHPATCTAPTSYLFTWTAFLGLPGLLLACLVTIVFDIWASLVIQRAAYPALAIGLVAAAAVNFMVSDFFTVLVSHGAALGLGMVYLMGRHGR